MQGDKTVETIRYHEAADTVVSELGRKGNEDRNGKTFLTGKTVMSEREREHIMR